MTAAGSSSPPQSPLSDSNSPDSPDRALSLATSAATDATSLSEYYAALASTPPCLDDFVTYPYDLSSSGTREARDAAYPSETLPSAEDLAAASALPVYDHTGAEVPFASLYKGRQYYGQQRLIVFVRHFYCRACKAFIKHLKQYFAVASAKSALAGSAHTIDKSIVIVGCGESRLIDEYVRSTQCPYPVYADPTLKVMRTLGCSRWAGFFPGERTDYTKENGNAMKAIATSLYDVARAFRPTTPCADDCGTTSETASTVTDKTAKPTKQRSTASHALRKRISKDGLRGGPFLQVGGEFLFEQGELVWCHRMRSSRGHTSPKTLRDVLDPTDHGPPPPAKDEPRAADDAEKTLTRTGTASTAAPSTQAWSKAEYVLLPGSHIIQQATPAEPSDETAHHGGLAPPLPRSATGTVRSIPRSRLSAKPTSCISESSVGSS